MALPVASNRHGDVMGIHMSSEEIEALYASIHRFAQKHVPECTPEQVKRVAKDFHDGNATRLDYALKLHWQLVEDRISSHPAKRFLKNLQECVNEAKAREQAYLIEARRKQQQADRARDTAGMEGFKPGDKVIKRTEKDAANWGKVMDRENTELFRKPGYIAVYFARQVWIKPENLMHFDEWKRKQEPAPQKQSVKNFWMEG